MKKQMKQMDYANFLDEILGGLIGGTEWNLKDSKMQFFVDGHNSEGSADEQTIRTINCKHYCTKSDVVRGDWLVIYKKDGSTYNLPMKLLFEFYCHMEDIKYVWMEIRTILLGLKKSGVYSLLDGLWNYEKKKENLVMRIVPCREETHDGCIGYTHGDIAVILCDKSESNTELSKIPYTYLGYWCKDEVSVVKETFEDMVVTNTAKIGVGIDVLENNLGNKKYLRTIDINTPLFLSNEEGVNGAVALYYNDSQTTISRLFTDGDFYVIMATADEAMIFPASRVTEKQVREKLQHILQNTPEEKVLSKQVRYYDSEKDTLEVL